MAWQLRRAFKAEGCLQSGSSLTLDTLADILDAFQEDICPGNNVGEALSADLEKMISTS